MMYTLLIGLLCLLVALYCLKFHYNSMNNVILLKKIVCKTPILYNSKEYLLTKLKALIVKQVTDITEDRINAFFTDNANLSIIESITCNQCYLQYDNISKCIIMISYVDEYSHKEDYYDCRIIDRNINFVYKFTIFKEGRSKEC